MDCWSGVHVNCELHNKKLEQVYWKIFPFGVEEILNFEADMISWTHLISYLLSFYAYHRLLDISTAHYDNRKFESFRWESCISLYLSAYKYLWFELSVINIFCRTGADLTNSLCLLPLIYSVVWRQWIFEKSKNRMCVNMEATTIDRNPSTSNLARHLVISPDRQSFVRIYWVFQKLEKGTYKLTKKDTAEIITFG